MDPLGDPPTQHWPDAVLVFHRSHCCGDSIPLLGRLQLTEGLNQTDSGRVGGMAASPSFLWCSTPRWRCAEAFVAGSGGFQL